jgi:DNA invertase Pin-like site-specific DNA recombinase
MVEMRLHPTLDELHALGVAFVSLLDVLDTTTAAGRFQMQILGAVAEFELGVIRERVVTGLARGEGSRTEVMLTATRP